MAFPVSKEEAKHAIGKLIKEQGLDAVTSAKIRSVLKDKFGQDFSAWKKEVDDLTREKIEEFMTKKEKEKKKNEKEKKQRSPSADGASGSSSNDEKNNADSDSDSGPDDVAPIRKSAARKRISAVSSTVDENEDMLSRVKRRRGNLPAPKSKSSKPRTKGTSAYSNVCYLSEELQAITGKAYMRRCDIVKCMWEYIRTNNLKSPKDGRIVICDENLQRCCKKPKFQAFGMMSWLKNHIFKPEDMGEEYVAEAQQAQLELVKELNDGAHQSSAIVDDDHDE